METAAAATVCRHVGQGRETCRCEGCMTHSQMSSSLAPGTLSTSSAPEPRAKTFRVSMNCPKCNPKPRCTHGQVYSEKSCRCGVFQKCAPCNLLCLCAHFESAAGCSSMAFSFTLCV